MADVDELILHVSANASDAVNNLSRLQTNLRHLARDIGTVASAGRSLDTLFTNLNKIASVDSGGIRRTASAIDRMKEVSKGIDTSSLSNMASELTKISSIDVKTNGVAALTSALARLGKVKDFDGESLKTMLQGVSEFANLDNISKGVTNLVSALARLASAGDKTKITATELPRLSSALRELITGLLSSGGIPDQLNAFVKALSALANAGDKVGLTASNMKQLSTAMVEFMASMANAPQVSESTVQFTTALAGLANAGSGAGNAAKALKSIDTSSKKTGVSLQQLGQIADKTLSKIRTVFSTAAQKIESLARSIRGKSSEISKIFSVGDGIKSIMGGLIGFRGLTGLVNITKQSVMLGASITEIDHIVESVFEHDMVGYVDNWAKEAISQFGIAEHSAKQYAGTLSAMFQAASVDPHSAGIMGMRLTELAGDLSAFFNIDTETAFNKIRSGMAGMVRPLRDLGIDLTAATLQEYALSQGITKSYQSMTQAEKIMLRYQYLMSATATQQGDFVRTSGSVANGLRVLRANAAAVSTQIGVGFASALRHVIGLLNTLMSYLLAAARAFATFMQTIFGKYKGGASGIMADMSGIAEDMDDAADSAASGLGGAAGSAGKIKKDLSVLPFDELNQLNKDSQSGGGGGGGGGAGGLGDVDFGDLMSLEEAFKSSAIADAISEWGERIRKAFHLKDWQKLGNEIAWGINQGIDKVYAIFDSGIIEEKVKPYISAFTQTLNSLTSSIHWQDMGRDIGAGITTVFNLLNELFEYNFHNLGTNFASFLNGIVSETNFGSIGEFFGNKFMALWNLLNGLVTSFRWDTLGIKLAEGVKAINDSVNLATVGQTLATFVNGIFETLKNLAENIPWDEVVDNIVGGINNFITTTNWEENAASLNKFVTNLCEALLSIVRRTNWEELGRGIATMLAGLPWGAILNVVAELFINALGGLLRGLVSSPEGAIAVGLIVGLNAISFAGKLTGLANNIVKAVTGESIFQKMFKTTPQGVPKTTPTPKTAVPGAGAGTGGAMAGVAGIATLAGGLLAAGAASMEVGKGLERIEGGNGILSRTAAILEGVGTQLRDTGAITNEQNSKLFDYIEGMESNGETYKSTLKGLIPQLVDTGITTDQFRDSMERLRASGDVTSQQFGTLNASFKLSKKMSEVAKKSYKDTYETIDKEAGNTVLKNKQYGQQATTSYADGEASKKQYLGEKTKQTQEYGRKKTMEILGISGGNSSVYKSLGEKSIFGAIEGWTLGTPAFITKIQDVFGLIQENAEGSTDGISKAGETLGKSLHNSLMKGLGNPASDIDKKLADANTVVTNQSDVEKKSTLVYAGKSLGVKLAEGLEKGLGTPSTNVSTQTESMKAVMEANKTRNDAYTAAKGYGGKYKSGVTDGAGTGADVANSYTTSFTTDTVKATFKSAGKDLGSALLYGISTTSKTIKPTITAASQAVTEAIYGAVNGVTKYLGSVSVPKFYNISWHKAGGLFMGGNGQVIGVAEGGRDEAVLPLENKKAMARIAGAITESGGVGLDENRLADAIASRLVPYLGGNGNDRYISNEIYLDGDRIARSVSKAQRRNDLRYNPSPAY